MKNGVLHLKEKDPLYAQPISVRCRPVFEVNPFTDVIDPAAVESEVQVP